MTEPIRIDIWSDIACPWCYIGARKLGQAIKAYARTEQALPVELEYHSFELMPDAPEDYAGSAVEFVASIKQAPHHVVQQMLDDVTDRAAEVGLVFDYDRLRNANTAKALQLLHYAGAHGAQSQMVERLFRAHFTEGRHVGRIGDLVEMAAEIGLDASDVQRALEVGEYGADVRRDIEEARAMGVQGVPFYVFDGRYALSGAQDPAVFASVLARAASERATVTA